jgi:EKC/KEOPS complex subunit CGI121/TPRKB
MSLAVDLVSVYDRPRAGSQNQPSCSTDPYEYTHRTLSLFMVQGCENASSLRSSLESLDAAFVDATMIPGLAVLRAAAGMACQGPLRSKSLHSELVFSLHGSKHIGRALSVFGIREDSRDVLVGKFDATDEEIRDLKERIHGHIVEDMDEIEKLLKGGVCDVEKVKKQYKVTGEELEVGTLEESVIGRIAARDCS